MSNVALSQAVRSNLLSLQNTASLLDATQTRLATGNKVNSALDNPTSYFTASSLNSRASDLSNLLDSVGNAIQTIQAANDGITSITKLVDSAKATANQAQQLAATVDSAAVAHADVTGSGYTAASVTTSTFTINGTSISTTAGDVVATTQASINAVTSTTGVSATVSGGELVLHAVTTAPGNPDGNITIGGTLTGLGLTAAANLGTAAGATQVANPARGALIAQYNGLLTQIDDLTKDAGYNGNNLLAGASTQLKVDFNETGTSSLTISGKDASSTGLGLAQLTSTAFDTNASITAIQATLKAATDTLRADASSFGSQLSIVQTRQDFTKSLINTLQTGAANLTLADSNEEAANLLALQTRQSLSTKALSLASQSDQNVLRLLQ